MAEVRGLMTWTRAAGPFQRVEAAHPASQKAARLVVALGGRASNAFEAGEMVYGFLSAPARDGALELVRRKVGWAVVSPVDRRAWQPEGPRPRVFLGRSAVPCRVPPRGPAFSAGGGARTGCLISRGAGATGSEDRAEIPPGDQVVGLSAFSTAVASASGR
jgi:hypothetical protein